MNFPEFLEWLISVDGGAFILVSWTFAWAFEEWKKWAELSSKIKTLITLGVSILIAVGAVILRQQPEIVAAIEPYANAVMAIVAVWLGTQTFHKLDPKRRENQRLG